jgi:hypothetical protein
MPETLDAACPLVQGLVTIVRNLLISTTIPKEADRIQPRDALCETNIDRAMWCRKAEFTGLSTIRTA